MSAMWQQWRRSRRDRSCECGAPIAKGERYQEQRIVGYEGRWWRLSLCEVCGSAYDDMASWCPFDAFNEIEESPLHLDNFGPLNWLREWCSGDNTPTPRTNAAIAHGTSLACGFWRRRAFEQQMKRALVPASADKRAHYRRVYDAHVAAWFEAGGL